MVDFLGIKTFIPRDPNKFLTRNYGPNYMKEFKSSSWDHKKAKRINDVVAIDSDELSNSKDLK